MQITFSGPDGQSITVSDPRRGAAQAARAVALPQERRPAGWVVASMKV